MKKTKQKKIETGDKYIHFFNQDLPVYKDWHIKMWFAVILPALFVWFIYEPHLILYFLAGFIMRYIFDKIKS